MPATAETQPRHGQERAFRQVVTQGPIREYLDERTGEILYRGPVTFGSHPEGERYCGKCGAWKAQKGIFSILGGCPDCGADWYETI